MKIKEVPDLEKIWLKVVNYPLSSRDQKLLIEALIILFIYSISFAILSMGRVQQTILDISPKSPSSIPLTILNFIFAIIIALIAYFTYKRLTLWR